MQEIHAGDAAIPGETLASQGALTVDHSVRTHERRHSTGDRL
jgi:hypothetical protein